MNLHKKFEELYNYIVASRDTDKMKMLGWVMKAMMRQTIDNHSQLAEEYINVLESVKWENYLTNKEAETIVSAMQPQPKWNRQQWENVIQEQDREHCPCYNSNAIYVAMCMIDSDDGQTIADLMGKGGVATNDKEYVDAIRRLALNRLMDKDKVFDIRSYFKKVLWPENK